MPLVLTLGVERIGQCVRDIVTNAPRGRVLRRKACNSLELWLHFGIEGPESRQYMGNHFP